MKHVTDYEKKRTRVKFTKTSNARGVFADNMRQLVDKVGTISNVARDLGLHRTQINRFLSGKSTPSPDVLKRICTYFDAPPSIILEPLMEPGTLTHSKITNERTMQGALRRMTEVDNRVFPKGTYVFWRYSFTNPHQVFSSLELFYTENGLMQMRGLNPGERTYESIYGQINAADRRYYGSVMQVKGGLMIMEEVPIMDTLSFTHLTQGYRTNDSVFHGHIYLARRGDFGGVNMTPIVYQHIPQNYKNLLRARRRSGQISEDDLPSLVRDILTAPIKTCKDMALAR